MPNDQQTTAATDEEIIAKADARIREIRQNLPATLHTKMAVNFSASFERKSECRRCQKPLPPDRAFQCLECDVIIEGERAAFELRRTADQIESRIERSGLPAAYRNGLRNFAHVRDADAVDLAERVLRGEARGLYLHGNAGPDKTSLAASTLTLWIVGGGTGLFVSMVDLMTDIYATMGEGAKLSRADLVKPLIETEMLVIDDLGKERATDYAAGVIFQILDGRYRQLTERTRRRLIITSNYNLARLCQRFADEAIAEPIERRISEMTTALEMK